QQVQGNAITPRVMKEQAGVPEFIVPLAVIAGSGVGGVLGALIVVPLVAMLRIVFLRVITPLIKAYTGASEIKGEHV
ncbi:MAG: AI-2E family transporter, partial [Anaerolineae bacterium]|nr:AI-2E family transporter [Anaerolineae bacterium]